MVSNDLGNQIYNDSTHSSSQSVAAAKIQKAWRRQILYNEEQYQELVKCIRCVRHLAAIEIQRIYRGYRIRSIVEQEINNLIIPYYDNDSKRDITVIGSFGCAPRQILSKMFFCSIRRCYIYNHPIKENEDFYFRFRAHDKTFWSSELDYTLDPLDLKYTNVIYNHKLIVPKRYPWQYGRPNKDSLEAYHTSISACSTTSDYEESHSKESSWNSPLTNQPIWSKKAESKPHNKRLPTKWKCFDDNLHNYVKKIDMRSHGLSSDFNNAIHYNPEYYNSSDIKAQSIIYEKPIAFIQDKRRLFTTHFLPDPLVAAKLLESHSHFATFARRSSSFGGKNCRSIASTYLPTMPRSFSLQW